ncbi:MAG: YetF domain-containing protein [Erythrobacter sp.]|nr:YetF domain-containing protein [Erythrobacter sp.]
MFFDQAPELDLLARTLVLGPLCLVIVVVATRVIGLRSFSKMTAFDFVSTVAVGSLLANAATASAWDNFFQASGAVLAVLGFQAVLSATRRDSEAFSRLAENAPVLLVRKGRWDEDALRRTRVTASDVRAKLREANAFDMDKVHAVVLETTGDISVLHGDGSVDEEVMKGVSGTSGERREGRDVS